MAADHATQLQSGGSPSYWSLVAEGEPFRLLFPIGLLLGAVGVLLWPLHVWQWWPEYPEKTHARLMMQGFLTAFACGFVATALPRYLGTMGWHLAETLLCAAMLLLVGALHAGGQSLWADQLFVLTMAGVLLSLAVRFLFRREEPPPTFLLVAMGFLSALGGTVVLILGAISPSFLPLSVMRLGEELLQEGYGILLIMGAGAFFLPRLFSPSVPQEETVSRRSADWWRQCGCSFLAGMLFLGTFVLEIWLPQPLAQGLRVLILLSWILFTIPLFRGSGSTIAWGARIALLCLPLGYGLMAGLPAKAESFEHVVYLGGMGLLVFLVATRAILGHSGQSHLFHGRLPSVLALAILFLLALLMRVSADWIPKIRLTHYAYAAVLWMVGAIVWSIWILPKVGQPDEER